MTTYSATVRTVLRPSALVCLLLLGLAVHPIYAQHLEPGLRGGLNLANAASATGASAVTLDTRPGIVAGGFLTWPVFNSVQLQPEVLYTSKGGSVHQDGITANLVLEYLELPLLARVTRRAFGSSRLYAAAGPSLGLRLRARTRARFSGAVEEIDVSDEVARTDLGIVVGGGLEAGSMVIDGRYTRGVSDLDTTTDVTMRNRAFSVSIGWKF